MITNTTGILNPPNSSTFNTGYCYPQLSLKESCEELYKQLLFYNIKKYKKDIITENEHKNMLSMLESNDTNTLELLRQILIGKALE